ncbi:protein-disulfide reductase DsbD domain-containing protein [Rhodobacter maris]|uniref:DsbC/DsbD-like thiol-disulfide interchange protein n=1 Tax=Rhodobacter maris TaxID=446682 RepID=A0A285RKV3_9RHOB|nr:protein-disulfide reductase DsbD domain-containing protein [Rhodobacter maris]SOB94710.1 DsbC/DsbD-like thiol-disulfide interchange protein [Rhodobacter maris]
MRPILPALPILLALALPVAAQEAALPPGLLGAEILPGWSNADGTRIAALQLRLAPGWKTYWRVPGEAGVPPILQFGGSENLAALRLVWPAPDVFEQNGMRTVGYHDGLVLPLVITPKEIGAPVTLHADLDFGICHEICVPVHLDLSATLDRPGAADPVIAAALASEPRKLPGRARCRVAPIRDGMRVEAAIALPPMPGEVALFELASRPMWVSDTLQHREGPLLMARAEFVPENGAPFPLDQGDLRITVVSAAGAVEIEGCPAP